MLSIITSSQEVDNVIPMKFGLNLHVGPSGVGEIKTTGNISIYRPRVFHVRSGPNQSYYPEFY